MKRTTLTIILLFLTKAIFADGVILNLKEYLQTYPHRIDEAGWVTIPRSDLIENTAQFDTKCQYQVIVNDHYILPITLLSLSVITFKFNEDFPTLTIINSNKIQVWRRRENENKVDVSRDRSVSGFKQLSPESIKYARDKYFRSNLRTSPAEFIELIVNMEERIKTLEKEANKSCCENCTIL